MPSQADISQRLAEWTEASVGWFQRGCEAVERGLQRLVSPIADEFRGIGKDLRDLRAELAEPRRPSTPRPGRRLGFAATSEIFIGSARQGQLKELEEDAAAAESPRSPEETQAIRLMGIGAATVVSSTLGMLYYPGLLLVGAAGLLYQVIPIFRDAYRALVDERRLSFYVLNAIVIVTGVLSGSFVAVTMGVWALSVLRWIITKTESMAQRSLASVFAKQPRSVWVRVGDAELQVPFAQIHPGDTIVVFAGEMIPVDGTVRTGMAAVDQRVLTGESQPVDRGPGDSVLASTFVLRGKLDIQVTRSGDDTAAAQVARILADTSQYKRQLRRRAETHLDSATGSYLVLGALTLPVWGLNSAAAVLRCVPGFRMLFFGPLTMLSFMHAASRKGILIKNGEALERLREVDTIIFDKTGTLTLEQPTAHAVFCFAEHREEEILRLAVTVERNQTHPIARAIQQAARERAIEPAALEAAEVVVGFGMGATIEGRRVLIGSERLMRTSGIELGPKALRRQGEVHEQGSSLIFVARAGELVGAIEIRPTVRPEAGPLIAALHGLGKQVLILSGDHEAPTRSLSAQLGIDRYFAQVLPEDKSKIVEELRQKGRVVCFVGDGINDAIALQRADVSISMKGATAVATNVAQIVLMNGNLELLLPLLEMSERFEHYMRYNRLATSIPAFITLGGTLVFGWGFATAVLLSQVSTPVGLYGLLGPAAEYPSDDPLVQPPASTQRNQPDPRGALPDESNCAPRRAAEP